MGGKVPLDHAKYPYFMGNLAIGSHVGGDDPIAKAKELGLKPLVKIKAHSSAGLDPAYMGLGPIPAVRKILHKHKLSINDFDSIELNEAFASQAIACIRELGCNIDKTNQLGSGISLGPEVSGRHHRIDHWTCQPAFPCSIALTHALSICHRWCDLRRRCIGC